MPSKWFQCLRINYKLLLNQKKWSVFIDPGPDKWYFSQSGLGEMKSDPEKQLCLLECQLKLFNAVMMVYLSGLN